MEISEKQGDCIENLEELSGDFQVELRAMQTKLNIDI